MKYCGIFPLLKIDTEVKSSLTSAGSKMVLVLKLTLGMTYTGDSLFYICLQWDSFFCPLKPLVLTVRWNRSRWACGSKYFLPYCIIYWADWD